MNWDSILNAYPAQTEAILGIKALHELTERVLSNVAIPELEAPLKGMDDFSAFIPILAPVCSAVWKETAGADPAFDIAEVLASFITGQDPPTVPEADRELTGAVINSIVSRFLHMLREKNLRLVPEALYEGDCPFCGSFAKIGFDAEDERTLACLSCGHTWRFPRLRCPACSNTDHATLGYFDAEGIEGVRVYFCKVCRHYFKVIDTRVRTVTDPETEDALTLELDDLAGKEGFSLPS
ncbi:MAG TPA: formate dehydrogenase accessory protein FdhE [Deltaproteobacteria bacterium]|jgi:Zn ribbon nucleic-acid-binding protein|nr:formate dehydrogenase accessory protein FdhE [Deltaproteobacteria bacterium]